MNGVINFLKPPGMSSNGAVVFLRGILNEKTGHAGTLDPGACGVLPICVGKGTKISSIMMGGKKEYIAEISFGKSTDTGDSCGNITGKSDRPFPEPEEIGNTLKKFLGRSKQQTPAYSAVKHKGRKLYSLAREGKDIPVKFRDIDIDEAEYLYQTAENAHLVRIVCGKGTYIRTLCEDIGKRLGTLSFMSFLIRTKCAGLCIENAYTADEIKEVSGIENVLLPIDSFLGFMPEMTVNSDIRAALFNGASVRYSSDIRGPARVYIDNEFLGIGQIKDGSLKITTLLAER
jgi:tRNA pseudouridine55 synthase